MRLWIVWLCFLSLSHAAFAQNRIHEPDWDAWVRPTQAVTEELNGPVLPNERRVRIQPRNGMSLDAQGYTDENGERVIVATSGVNILIYNVGGLDTADISADRIVIWTSDKALSQLRGADVRPDEVPLEFYMEGNIVFRQTGQTIYAERMYYDVQTQSGVILNGEMLTPIPGYKGMVRLKAEVIQQLNQYQFEGRNGGVTTSRMGVPSYWLQTGQFSLNNVPRSSVDPATGLANINPETGRPELEYDRMVTSRNNLLFLGSVPVLYWPSITSNLNDPRYYLNSFAINNDRVFGTQVLTGFNLYQLLGIYRPIENTEWSLNLDYLSERGFGFGTEFNYNVISPFGLTGRAVGFLDAWGINEEGFDNLGRERRSLVPEEDFRGRIFGRHRHFLPGGFQFNGEIGLISDRNFLEQYYEQDWDEKKDFTTGVELKRTIDNRSWSVTADGHVNDFFTQTEWLPRLDHFWIGESILGDWLTWQEHSTIGYGHVTPATTPLDPADAAKFDPLAWESDSEGLRATTRHEVSLPLNAGPFRVVPYALGEAAHWHEDQNAVDVDRLYGQAGVRASIPMWRADSTIQSKLFNVNGIAHKVVFDTDIFFADANEDLGRLALYDQLDDDAIEAFRRRFFFDTFGGMPGGNVPLKYDERFYAHRSNLQGWVTSPSSEIADDLTAARLGMQHRWQTKRGLPGRQHIIDFVSFNMDAYIYPEADRDNFGQEVGLIQYDFKWHPGDRFTVLSDGHFDLFSEGLRTFFLGAVVTRPTRSNYAVGFRSIEGPISSQILFSSTTYRISPKWIVKYGSSYDFGKTGNLGQNGQIVRVGESFLVGVGFNYDSSRDNLGFRFAIEPRFLSGKLSRVGGIPIPPVGYRDLE